MALTAPQLPKICAAYLKRHTTKTSETNTYNQIIRHTSNDKVGKYQNYTVAGTASAHSRLEST